MPSSRPEAGQRLPDIPLPASSLTFGGRAGLSSSGNISFDKTGRRVPALPGDPFPDKKEADMPIRLLQDMECSGKTVVIRQDLNVPMKDGRITNDKRIRAAPARHPHGAGQGRGRGPALASGPSHRRRGGRKKFSLAPVAAHLSGLLGRPVKLAADFDAAKAAPGEVVLLENIPLLQGRKEERSRTGRQTGRSGRHLCHGRLRGRPPRPLLHRRGRARRQGGLRRAAHGRRTGRLRQVLDAPARPLIPLSAVPRSPPSWACWTTCWARWIPSSWAAASPTPSWPLPVTAWAPPCMSPSWWTMPGRS